MFTNVRGTTSKALRRVKTWASRSPRGLQSATLKTAVRNRRGVASVEYAILLVGVVVVIGTSVVLLRNAFLGAMATAGTELVQQQAILRGDNLGASSRTSMGGGAAGNDHAKSEQFPATGADITNPRVVVHIDGMR